MNRRQEVTGGFVVAGGDGPELLDLGEEILDKVPRLVGVPAAASGARTRASASKALSAMSSSAAMDGSR